MDIWVARHGLTQFNVDHKVMGRRHDEPLLPKGIEQAHVLAQSLLARDFRRVLSSPLKRALQTTEIVAQRLQIPCQVLSGLIERDSGVLGGKTWAEIGEYTNGLITRELLERQHEIDFSAYGGQTIEQVRAQLEGVFAQLRNDFGGEKVLLVTHGGIIRVMYAMVKPGESFVLANASVHQFTI